MNGALRHDARKTFSQFREGPFEIETYPWRFRTGSEGLMIAYTEWMLENCEKPWAWWFDEDGICNVGFMDQGEMMEFSLRYTVD